MTVNEGKLDRAVRIVLGLALIAMVFIGPQTPWGWVGIVPLLTGLVGYCPLYSIFGINTCAMKS
ncbi:YgaP family membrane protein [Rhodophyticola sp. SM2404]